MAVAQSADLVFQPGDLGAALTRLAADMGFAQIFPDQPGQHPDREGQENDEEQGQADRPGSAQELPEIRRKGRQRHHLAIGEGDRDQHDGQKGYEQQTDEAHG